MMFYHSDRKVIKTLRQKDCELGVILGHIGDPYHKQMTKAKASVIYCCHSHLSAVTGRDVYTSDKIPEGPVPQNAFLLVRGT